MVNNYGLNRGNENSPICNTGVTMNGIKAREHLKQIASKQTLIVQTKKGALEVPIRVPCGGEYVVVDALNFVVGLENFGDYSQYFFDSELTHDEKVLVAEEVAIHIAVQLSEIFGPDFLEVTYTGRGLHFYKYGFTIGHKDATLGKIGIGGQNSTVLVMISGTGCKYADDLWESNLYYWLKNEAKRAKLTRIDFAHDDFEGKYSSAEIANTADSQGMFVITNKLPSVQLLGDWKRHEGKGHTLQVGKRENGKLYRGYEKGKEQGDSESPWFRHEVEFGTAGRLLEFEMLISPTEYFAGAYPYTLEVIEHAKGSYDVVATRIECVQKEAEISLDKSIAIWKRQAGRYIAVYRELFQTEKNGELVLDDTLILDMLMTDKKDFYPPRLKIIEKFNKNPPSYAPSADRETVSV